MLGDHLPSTRSDLSLPHIPPSGAGTLLETSPVVWWVWAVGLSQAVSGGQVFVPRQQPLNTFQQDTPNHSTRPHRTL